MITNPTIRLENFISTCGQNKELILSADELTGTPGYSQINTGIFLIKNTPLMIQFLEKVWLEGPIRGYLNKFFHEQSTMYELIQENTIYKNATVILPMGILQSFLRDNNTKGTYDSNWKPNVFSAHAAGIHPNERRAILLNNLMNQGHFPQEIPQIAKQDQQTN